MLSRQRMVTMRKPSYTWDTNFKPTIMSKAEEQVETQEPEKRMHGAIAGWASWVVSHQVYILGRVQYICGFILYIFASSKGLRSHCGFNGWVSW